MRLLIIGYLSLWILGFIAACIFFFVVLKQRLKERKQEKDKHRDYNKY